MATTKKSPVKKKAVSKKAPAKKVAQKKTANDVKSFKVSPDYPSFTTFKITRQTVYWTILISFIIFMQLWILRLQMETSEYIEAEITALQEANDQ